MKLPTIVLPVLVASTALGQPASTDVPEKYRDLIGGFVGADGPGGYIGVYRHADDVVEETVFGMADIDAGRPMTVRTPLYIASVAKRFTAACAVRAADAGLLDLDASILELVPELGSPYGAVTARDLMHHRSGVTDVYDVAIACDLPASVLASNAAAIALMARLPEPMFAPGEQFVYSNSGYVLLAEAVARAAGTDFPTFARTTLFDPAGMTGAVYLDEASGVARARSYARSASGWTPRDVRTGLNGPGGLLMSGHDLISFERASARGAIDEPASPLPAGPSNPRLGRYGAGWLHQALGDHRVVRHYGGAFGFAADLLRLPDDGLSVVVLVNTEAIDVTDLAEAVARIELGDRYRPRTAPDAFPLTGEQRRAFGRIWRETTSDRLWVVTDRGDHFVLAALGDLKVRLVPVAADRLAAVDAHVPFSVRAGAGMLTLEHDDGSVTSLTPVAFPPVDAADAALVAGRYRSAALGATIELEPGPRGTVRLVQHDPILALPPFIPVTRNSLICDRGAQIELVRDAEGAISGLVMHANRAWGLSFERVWAGE